MSTGASDWTALPLDPDVQVVVDAAMPVLDASVEDAVEAIWQAQCRVRPSLFNGRVFCADTITPARIGGHWTEYRRVLAQMTQPALFGALRIRALAVNGLIECADGLLLGRRQAGAVYLAGCWQATPAGNVEARGDGSDHAGMGVTVDIEAQLMAELEEELGLRREDVAAPHPVLAMEHAGTHIVDIGILLQSRLDLAAIEARRAASGNDEYEALIVVAPAHLPEFLQQAGPTLLPSARFLIACWQNRQPARR